MNTLFLQWHFDIILLLLMAAMCIVYLYMLRFKPVKQGGYFFAGMLVMIIAVASPLHFLGVHFLFSAHMVTHVLLLLVAAPLMVLGIPVNNRCEKALKNISKASRKWPAVNWFIGIGIMWFWHIPAVYRQLMQIHTMPEMHHASHLLNYAHIFSLWIAGVIFTWIVIGPYPQYRIPPLTGVLYLATACIGCSLLGLLITFAPDGLYTMLPVIYDANGFEKIIHDEWGITSTVDQQIAGLIMWVPCCFIYLAGAMFLLKKWLNEKDENLWPDLSL